MTALYQVHALGLVRLAHVMLGDRAAAEDIVQEAFGGLYRRWAHVLDNDRALQYLRSSVLNGCRSALRRRRFADAENRQGFVFLIPELAQDDGLRFVPSG